MNINRLLGSFFGLGYSPMAPGTMGAIGGVLLWSGVKYYELIPDKYLLVLVFILFLIGRMCADRVEKVWGKDPPQFVLDEVVGMLVSLLFVPFSWNYIIPAFLLFRFFDIVKPLLIRRIERLHGGWGIMMDDLLAGAYSNLILQFFIWRAAS